MKRQMLASAWASKLTTALQRADMADQGGYATAGAGAGQGPASWGPMEGTIMLCLQDVDQVGSLGRALLCPPWRWAELCARRECMEAQLRALHGQFIKVRALWRFAGR